MSGKFGNSALYGVKESSLGEPVAKFSTDHDSHEVSGTLVIAGKNRGEKTKNQTCNNTTKYDLVALALG